MSAGSSVPPGVLQDTCPGALLGRGGNPCPGVCCGCPGEEKALSRAVPWVHVPGPRECQSGYAGYAT